MHPNDPKDPLLAAIEAAKEFKHFIDVQPAKTLFNPCGKCEVVDTATYARAAALLEQAIAQSLDCSKRPRMLQLVALPVIDVVSNHGADRTSGLFDFFGGVIVGFAQRVSQLITENASRGEYGGFLEVSIRIVGKANLPVEQIEGERDAVHGVGPGKVDEQPLCHGGADAQGAR